MSDGRIRAWVALANTDGLGARELHTLLSAFGSAEAVLEAPSQALAAHVPSHIAEGIRTGSRCETVESILAWGAQSGNHILAWDDPCYPKALLQIGETPPVLYYKGRTELLNAPSIAIVGSRNASPAGIRIAEEFAETLAAAGLTVISGLALGIDAAAHRGGLRAGRLAGSTIAVVGTGIDRIYPAANEALAHRIAVEGGLLSEFPLGTPPVKANFPQRNRLISGLSMGVLVVEAAIDSGSLITARLAGDQGREVFAIPGSIHSPFSKGCHRLIKQGAKLVESTADILDELQIACRAGASEPCRSGSRHSPAGKDLLRALGFDPITVDELVARLSWPIERVMTHLLELEMSGTIAQMPGGGFQRVR
jgi:DNA processing protein